MEKKKVRKSTGCDMFVRESKMWKQNVSSFVFLEKVSCIFGVYQRPGVYEYS